MTLAADLILDLPSLAEEVLEQARAATAGRAGRTLTPGAGAHLKQAVLALSAGSVLADHESPDEATLYVLSGSVRLTTASGEALLDAGAYTSIPPVRHGVQALEDAVMLITVAQG